jgi:hypothetical protein
MKSLLDKLNFKREKQGKSPLYTRIMLGTTILDNCYEKIQEQTLTREFRVFTSYLLRITVYVGKQNIQDKVITR